MIWGDKMNMLKIAVFGVLGLASMGLAREMAASHFAPVPPLVPYQEISGTLPDPLNIDLSSLHTDSEARKRASMSLTVLRALEQNPQVVASAAADGYALSGMRYTKAGTLTKKSLTQDADLFELSDAVVRIDYSKGDLIRSADYKVSADFTLSAGTWALARMSMESR
jgi:hypothetical protein